MSFKVTGQLITTTLTVKVQESSSDSTTNTYKLSTGVTGIDSTSEWFVGRPSTYIFCT